MGRHGSSELGRINLNDPGYVIQLAVGPPFPDLVPQQPGSGMVLAGRFDHQPHRFVFKKAHMSRDDFRIFDAESGRVVAAMYHFGKNPYGSLDPLSLGNFTDAFDNKLGEWDSLCGVAGYNGMPSLKVRPKTISRHGRQFVYEEYTGTLLFNIGKESKLKNLAIRSNLAIRKGDTKEVLYRILPDLLGRTLQVVNPNGDLVCFIQKSTKTLIMEATLGAGSEMVIDVAPGVDWTAMVAIVMALQQVGAHFVKDAFSNYVVGPLTGAAVAGAVEAAGVEGAAGQLGDGVDVAASFVNQAQAIYQMFVQP